MSADLRGRRALHRAREARHRARLKAADGVVALGEGLRLGSFLRLDYPPSRTPGPRYGYGRPPHPGLAAVVEGHRGAYRETLDGLGEHVDAFRAIPLAARDDEEPEWVNGWLPGLDGAALYALPLLHGSRRYVEVGSGSSTRFVARARRDAAAGLSITSIDPRPRRGVDALCDVVIRTGLEEADLGLFSALEAGDIVFFDGSHRTFMGSDATVFFLEVLPALAPGVLVGVHDVYLPDDYPPDVAPAFYSEQYLLASWLLAAPDSLRPVLASSFVSRDRELGRRVDDLWRRVGRPGIERHGVAFWFETTGQDTDTAASVGASSPLRGG